MTKTDTKQPTSRRDWFAGSAALLGAGALGSALLRAQSPGATNDVNMLNFLLRLENLENAFYSAGLSKFAPKDATGSTTVQLLGGTKIGASLYPNLVAIGLTEQDHVTKLVQTIIAMGGTPQAIDCYNFGLTTLDSFLQTAATLENLGVQAYNAVIGSLQNAGLQTLVATIATIEARHAAYFNLLGLTLPFPSPFDSSQTMAQIQTAINPYLTTGCNVTPVQLTYAQAGPTKHAIITTNQTTIRLDGTKSTSANGQPLSFLWQQDLGSPLFAITNDQFPTATAILMGGPGEYSIGLRVTDTFGNTDQDVLKIIYQP